ncbi:MAG TPA: Rne/Rng family ribonuclease [Actinomycetota bacterium]|nr:Rne/Rng family ribonuclease [Actinomycetota bacterium]
MTSDPPGDASPGAASDAADADDRADPTEASDAPEGGTSSSTKRRRRRRRRKKPSDSGDGEAAADPSSEAKPDTKPASKPADGRRSRAKPKQKEDEAPPATRTARRRRGVVTRRRCEPEIRPERRLDKIMLITENGDRDQIAVAEGRELVEHYVTRAGARSMVGNVYLGRVQNVLPGMEAAFIDLGRGRNAVLYAGEVSHDEDVEEQPRRIEQVLKPGQPIVVQVTKDPMGGKGARLTGQISLAGRYLVYVPGGSASGISRRLPEKERNRLRGIMKEIRPSGAGVIIRTAAEGATPEGLEEDLERLKKTWESIRRKSRRGKPPKVLYEEPELTIRVLRDVFSAVEFREVVTDSESVYERVTAYLKEVAPDILDRVRLHQGPLPVFEEYHVHEQIHKALERKVWLPSGGYLIIDRTEAMTVVDVNTGKAVGKTNLEETVVQTNLEAAREIARQLRLRDIGGIIVIDFIDMLLQANRNKVIRALKEEMAQDKTRSQVFDITPLGLLEVTRKRVSAGLVESFSQTCPTCEGRGILVSLDTEGN